MPTTARKNTALPGEGRSPRKPELGGGNGDQKRGREHEGQKPWKKGTREGTSESNIRVKTKL